MNIAGEVATAQGVLDTAPELGRRTMYSDSLGAAVECCGIAQAVAFAAKHFDIAQWAAAVA